MRAAPCQGTPRRRLCRPESTTGLRRYASARGQGAGPGAAACGARDSARVAIIAVKGASSFPTGANLVRAAITGRPPLLRAGHGHHQRPLPDRVNGAGPGLRSASGDRGPRHWPGGAQVGSGCGRQRHELPAISVPFRRAMGDAPHRPAPGRTEYVPSTAEDMVAPDWGRPRLDAARPNNPAPGIVLRDVGDPEGQCPSRGRKPALRGWR